MNPIGGGILNLTLGNTMTKEECLEIVKKLNDISQNKFYTVNIYDTVSDSYYGDCELIHKYSNEILLIHTHSGSTGDITTRAYHFYIDGNYKRQIKTHGNINDILSRLDKIEEQLGI